MEEQGEAVNAIVIVRPKDSNNWRGLGGMEFAVSPRIGEYLSINDDDGIGQAYRIVAVLHAPNMGKTIGDILAVYECTDVELRSRLREV